jgi:hypothetical protein
MTKQKKDTVWLNLFSGWPLIGKYPGKIFDTKKKWTKIFETDIGCFSFQRW